MVSPPESKRNCVTKNRPFPRGRVAFFAPPRYNTEKHTPRRGGKESFRVELTSYMNDAIGRIFREALLSSRLNPRELAFLSRAAGAQKDAARRRSRAAADGNSVPPFLIASVAARCNLHCAGCYARANGSCADGPAKQELDAARWGELFREAEELGVSFVLLAGGEPLERPDVLDEAAKREKLIFPVFTNGTLFTSAMLDRFDRYRNLVPVLSAEGNRDQTDRRRGAGVYDAVRRAMEGMKRLGLFFGVSATVTKENLDTVTGSDFVSDLREAGSRLLFLVEYVPADGNAAPALDDRDRKTLDIAQRALSARFPDMVVLSFPGDEAKMGGCLAAGRGFFHINAAGGAEPCPFSPFSDTSLKTGSLRNALDSELFRKIRDSSLQEPEHVGGCALFPRSAEIENLLKGGSE